MTPGDVVDEILRDERLPPVAGIEAVLAGARGTALRVEVLVMFDALLAALRPGDAPRHTPLRPDEVERLQVAVAIIGAGLAAAYARNPAPVYVVQDGGR